MTRRSDLPPDDPSIALDARVAMRIGHLPIVGRQTELALVDQVLNAFFAGESRIFLISGEAGIGKSRLIAELCRRAETGGAIAAVGRSVEEQGTPPFLPWIDVANRLIAALPSEQADRLGSPFDMLQGAEHNASSLPLSKSLRPRLFSSVASWIASCAASQPMVLAFDDLQWADSSTLHLITYLVEYRIASGVLLVGAFREEEVVLNPALEQALGQMRRTAAPYLLHLAPLPIEGTEQLISELIGRDTPALSQRLHQRGEGNPFVIEELVRTLIGRSMPVGGSLFDLADEIPLPATIAGEIRLRLDQLEPRQRELVEMAATVGRGIDLELISRGSGAPLDDVVEAIERAKGLGLTRSLRRASEQITYEFSHDRVRAAILEAIRPSHKKVHHQHVIAALLDRGPGAWELPWLAALSYHAGHAGDVQQAAGYAERLGTAALTAHAPEEATQAFRQAIERSRTAELSVAPIEFALLYMKLGKALMASGDSSAAESFGQAERIFAAAHDRRSQAEALRLRGMAYSRHEEHLQALACLELASEILADVRDADQERAILLLQLGNVLGTSLARLDEAIAAGREALVIAERSSEGRLRAEASLALGQSLLRANQLHEGHDRLMTALHLAMRVTDQTLTAEIAGALANHAYWTGNLHDSAQYARQRWRLAQATGDRFMLRHARSWLALVETSGGHWAKANELLKDAADDIAPIDSPEPQAFLHQVAGWSALYQGQVDEAIEHLVVALEGFRQVGQTTLPWYIGVLALAYCVADRAQECLETTGETIALIESMPREGLAVAPAMAMVGIIAARQRDRTVRTWYGALSPFAGQLHWVLVDRVRGELAEALGDLEAAERHFKAAIEMAAVGGVRPEGALASAGLAVLQLKRGDAKAESALRQAIDHLSAIGMRSEADRFAACLKGAGSSKLPYGITKREAMVLSLVARGMTNRDIAEDLSISEKTVINHLTNVYTKANLDNRAAAAALATRSRIAP
jgi:predicted ATPase/DNA-binding CsgD family transcriptional regulator